MTRDTRITRRERDAENRWREASRIRSDRAWSSSRRVVAFPIAPTFSDDKRSAPRSRCIHGGARTSRTSRRCLRGAENGSTRSFWPHRYIASRSALHRDVKGDVWVSGHWLVSCARGISLQSLQAEQERRTREEAYCSATSGIQIESLHRLNRVPLGRRRPFLTEGTLLHRRRRRSTAETADGRDRVPRWSLR